MTFAEISAARASVRLRPGEFCEELDGQVHPGVVALLVDVALASVVCANLAPAQQLATVSLQLQFSGAPITGPLEACGEFAGFLQGAAGQQGLSRSTMIANGQTVLLGRRIGRTTALYRDVARGRGLVGRRGITRSRRW